MIIWTLKLFCNPRQRCTNECRGARAQGEVTVITPLIPIPEAHVHHDCDLSNAATFSHPAFGIKFSFIRINYYYSRATVTNLAIRRCPNISWWCSSRGSFWRVHRPISTTRELAVNTASAESAFITWPSSSKFRFTNPDCKCTRCFTLRNEWSRHCFLWTRLSSRETTRNYNWHMFSSIITVRTSLFSRATD